MAQFSIILNQIGGFFLFLAVGVFLRRKAGILDERSLFVISEITIKVALTSFIFTSIVSGTTLDDFKNAFPLLLVMIMVYVIIYFVGRLFCRIFSLEGNSAHAYRLCMTFGNVGLVGVPIVTELYPDTAMIVIAVATVIDQLIMWTYGVNLTFDVESEEGRQSVRIDAKRIRSILLNPPFLAILISLLFITFKLPVPTFINNTLERFGAMLTPLGMLYVGGMLEWSHIRYVLTRVEIYVAVIFKMIVLPVFIYFFMVKIAHIDRDMSGTFAIILGIPVFMAATILTKNNGSDYRLASGMMMFSTVAFMITYPILSILLSLI